MSSVTYKYPGHNITFSFQLVGRKLLYIFKENFLPECILCILPIFKHQTTPYNVLFFQKMKKICLSFFLFKQEQEVSGRGLTTTTKPHVHDVCNPDSLYTVFYLIYHFYHVYLCNKCYQTSPIYTLMSFSPKNQPL